MSASALNSRPQPQQARSLATRSKLLSAVVSSLIEVGYTGTSTTEVCRRAGVSQGALFKHYSSKAALLAAAVHQLFGDLVAEYRRDLAAFSAGGDSLEAAIRLLWQSFNRPKLQAAYDLYGVSRTDPEMRQALQPALAAHREGLRRESHTLFPWAAAENQKFDAVVDVILDAMQGRVFGGMVLREERRDEDFLAVLAALARRELGSPEEPTERDPPADVRLRSG